MAESTKERWPVKRVKLKDTGAPAPDSMAQPRMEFSEAKELRIEFDTVLRLIVLTHMRPGKTETDERVPNPERAPVKIPIENVAWMQ